MQEKESCDLRPYVTVNGEKVKDPNGDYIPSQLWDDLLDMCLRIPNITEEQATDQAIQLWKLCHHKPFLDEYSENLRYSTIRDENGNLSQGEVTYSSLMSVISDMTESALAEDSDGYVTSNVEDAIVNAYEQKLVEDLNKQIVPNREEPPSIAQQTRRAVSLLEELSKNKVWREGRYPTIRYTRAKGNKGKKTGVEIYLSDDPNTLGRFIKHENMLIKLQDFLNKKGLDYKFLREEESNTYTDFENTEDGYRKAYEHLQGVIKVVISDTEQDEVTLRQAAKMLSYMLSDTPLYQRIVSNLNQPTIIALMEEYNTKYGGTVERENISALFNNKTFEGYRPVMEMIILDALKKQSTKGASLHQAIMLRFRNFIHSLPFTKADVKHLKQQRDTIEATARSIVKRILNDNFSDESLDIIDENVRNTPADLYSENSIFGSTAALSDPYRVGARKALNTLREIGEDLGALRKSDLNRFLRAYRKIDSMTRSVNTMQLKAINMDIAASVIQEVSKVLSSEYDKMINDLSKLDFDKDDVTSKNATTLYQAQLFINKIKELREQINFLESYIPEGKTDSSTATDGSDKISPEEKVVPVQDKLKKAKEQLDYFTNKVGGSNSLEEAIQVKTSQYLARFCEDFLGRPYVETVCGVIWKKDKNGKLRLYKEPGYQAKDETDRKKRYFFSREDAVKYHDAYEEIQRAENDSEKPFNPDNLSDLAKKIYREEFAGVSVEYHVDMLQQRLDLSAEEQNNPLLEVLTKDVGWISSTLYSMMYSGDIMNQFKDYAIKQQKGEANLLIAKDVQEINSLMLELKKISQPNAKRMFNVSDAITRKFAEKDKDGITTGFFVTPYNLGKWHQEYEEAMLKWEQDFIKQHPEFEKVSKRDPAKRLALDAYINKQKRLWHKTHSHWDKDIQQYLPGIKVKAVTPESPTISDLFYTETESNVPLKDYDNTDADFNTIEKEDSKFRNASDQANRTSGYYEDKSGRRSIRFHRLQEVDEKGNRIPSSVEANKQSEPEWIRSSELGSRTDAFLRVVFDTKGNFDDALRAANAEQVELGKDMKPKLFDMNNSEDKAYVDKVYKDAVNLMNTWASKGIKWKTTNLIVNTSLGGLRIAGEMDVLLKYPDGTFEVWDMKTSNKTANNEFSPEVNVNYEAQLNFYAQALRDAGYNARVGGIIKIDADEGGISLAARTDKKLSELKLQPFNLKDKSQKRIDFIDAIKAQAAVEGNDVKDNSIFEKEEATIYDELAEAKAWQVIAYVEKFHPKYAKAVKAFFEHSNNQSPMGVLKRFGLQPKSANDIYNMLRATEEGTSQDGYTINYLGYKSEQWDKLSNAEKSWMMKVLDLKTRMDSKYPSVPYGLMPQFQSRTIEKVRAISGSNNDLLGSLNPIAWAKTFKRNFLNTFMATADDYEFGDASTFNGDESSVISSEWGYLNDRLQRMPIIGVNRYVHSRDAMEQRKYEKEIAAENITDERREKARKRLIQIKRDASKELSTEIFHSLAAYSVATNNYACLRAVVDSMEVLESVMHRRKDESGDSLTEAKTSTPRVKSNKRALEQSRIYLNKELYNVHTKRLAIGPIVVNKIINFWAGVTSFTTIAGNPMAAITNKKVGQALTFDESIIKEHYTLDEWRKAEGMWLQYMWTKAWFSPSSDSGKTHIALGDDLKQDKLSLFLRWSDSQRKVKDTYMKYNPQKSKFRKLNPFTGLLYMPFELGDAYMQGMSSIACALHTKLYDTTTEKEINLWDALIHDTSNTKKTGMGELVIKDGVIKNKRDAKLYAELLDKIANEEAEIEKEKERMKTPGMSAASKVLAKARVSAKQEQIKKYRDQIEEITWQDSDTNNFSIYVGNVNVGLHGVYNSIDRAEFQYEIYGKMISMMRGYALGNLHRVFGTYNIQLSMRDTYGNPKGFEGEMNAVVKALAYIASGTVDSDPNKSSIGETSSLQRLWDVINFVNREKELKKAGFSAAQIYAIKRFNVHIGHLLLRWVWLGMLNRWIKQLLAHLKSRDDLDENSLIETEDTELQEIEEEEFDPELSENQKAKLKWNYNQFLHNLSAYDPELLVYRLLGTYTAIATRTQWESMAFLTPKGLLTEIPQVFDANPLSISMLFRFITIGDEIVTRDPYSRGHSASMAINKNYQVGDSKGVIHALKLLPWMRFTFSWMDPDSYIKSYLFFRMVNAGLRQGETNIFDKLRDTMVSLATLPGLPEPESKGEDEEEEEEI